MIVERALEMMARASRMGRDPRRHPDPQAVRVHLRRGDVVEVAAVLVVGEDEGRAVPRGESRRAVIQVLQDPLPDRDVGGRVLVVALRA